MAKPSQIGVSVTDGYNNINVKIVKMGYENMKQAQVGHTGIEPFHYSGKFCYHLSHCHLVELPKALVINASHLVLAEL